ncbi:MAG: glycerophosphodiester phosphodiesterase [Acidobacteriia bacterium]|nr:glycerophosphodiester phosphodiesterase [Terriglobia bacterium]
MKLIAHRGDSAHAPENTLEAFRRAIRCGAPAVECDLQRTRDGQWTVLHDAILGRTTNGRGLVRRKSAAELRRLSAGYRRKFGDKFLTEPIPTFEDLLRLLQPWGVHLYAEIKREALWGRSKYLESLVTPVDVHKMISNLTFISFDWRALKALHTLNSNLSLGLLFEHHQPRRLFAAAERIGAKILIGHVGVVERHPDLVTWAHQLGTPVGVYTVDSLERLRKLERLGIDAAATNRICEFQRFFNRSALPRR